MLWQASFALASSSRNRCCLTEQRNGNSPHRLSAVIPAKVGNPVLRSACGYRIAAFARSRLWPTSALSFSVQNRRHPISQTMTRGITGGTPRGLPGPPRGKPSERHCDGARAQDEWVRHISPPRLFAKRTFSVLPVQQLFDILRALEIEELRAL